MTSNMGTQVKLFICLVCLQPDDGGTMVFREQCQEWFYPDKCISPKFNDEVKEDDDWFCEQCS